MSDHDKIMLAAVVAFVGLAWVSAWAFTQTNGYPVQWYWLPIAVTAGVSMLSLYGLLHAKKKGGA